MCYSGIPFFFGTFSIYLPMGRGVARRDPVHVSPKVKLVCIPCFKSVTPRVCLAKVPFLAFFGHVINRCGQIRVPKTSPRLY